MSRFQDTPNEKSLRKGLRLLEILAFSPRPRSVSDLAREAGITASNAHRLLSVLTELGYVQQDGPRAGYFATLWLNELGIAVGDRIDMRQLLAPQLRALNESTEEAVGIAIWRDGGTTLIARLESRHPVRLYTRLGSRLPSHLTSGGQVLLAFRPDAEFEDYVRANIPNGPSRAEAVQALRNTMAKVREERVARVRDGWLEGLSGIAVPLFHGGEVFAALNVSGPTERFTTENMESFLKQLRSSARVMEQLIHGRGAAVQ